jgi:hypothetical protein
MPRLSTRELLMAVGRQLEPEPVKVTTPTFIGNRPPAQRFFSTREDVPAHFHPAGPHYCGRCMRHVVV